MTGWNKTDRVGIITSLLTGRPMNGGSIWDVSKLFVSPAYTLRKDLKRTQPSYSVASESYSPRLKWSVRDVP